MNGQHRIVVGTPQGQASKKDLLRQLDIQILLMEQAEAKRKNPDLAPLEAMLDKARDARARRYPGLAATDDIELLDAQVKVTSLKKARAKYEARKRARASDSELGCREAELKDLLQIAGIAAIEALLSLRRG